MRDQKGQGLVEYAMLLVLVVAIVIAAVTPFHQAIRNAFQAVVNIINTESTNAQG